MARAQCDVCGRPATHFLSTAYCHTDGRPGSSTGTQLCDEHAAAYENVMARETMDSLLAAWRLVASFAGPADFVEIDFDARDEGAANRFAADLMGTC